MVRKKRDKSHSLSCAPSDQYALKQSQKTIFLFLFSFTKSRNNNSNFKRLKVEAWQGITVKRPAPESDQRYDALLRGFDSGHAGGEGTVVSLKPKKRFEK